MLRTSPNVGIYICEGSSDAAQRSLPPDIKKEEEEEESVTQRGDLLDFTDQDHYKTEMEENQNHYKTEMEENQNPEHNNDNPVKREEPDSPSATTDRQVSVHDVMINRLHNQTTDTLLLLNVSSFTC